MQQNVGNPDLFMNIFTQRVKDCAFQEWESTVANNNKLVLFADLHKDSGMCTARYLEVIEIVELRRMLTKIRCSNHPLEIERDVEIWTGN